MIDQKFNEISEYKSLREFSNYVSQLLENKLWVKVLVAMLLGALAGMVLSPATGWVPETLSLALGDWLALPGKLFLKLVQMIMIPLVVTSIMTGILSAGIDNLKKMGLGITLYFVFTTAVAVFIGIVFSILLKPGTYFFEKSGAPENQPAQQNMAAVEDMENKSAILTSIPDAVTNLLPDNPLASMVSGEMLPIVLFSIIIGIAITQIKQDQRKTFTGLLSATQEICMTVVNWSMKLVPYAVFGLVAQLISTIGVSSLKSLGYYAMAVLLGLFTLMLFYLVIVRFFGKVTPLHFLRSIRDLQLLAFSTTSSAAVMPLSIKTAQEKLGVDKSTSNFIIPIGATINMDGTALYQVISTIFIAQAYGIEMGMPTILLLTITVVAASIGTPAIPGGGVVILASVLTSVGIPTEGIVLIIGVERILGMFRSAVNVTGDMTACLVFNRREEQALLKEDKKIAVNV
ncbi:dicarboxylate/amino acid:cation symporter [Ascidiimonas aurantiaca]|uniref:dicarboxylate/amino acid:cation symporter n=1 Tax=Ascidiimonas aurantiaca TaxID=1685432 RepID=UPI0030EF67C8